MVVVVGWVVVLEAGSVATGLVVGVGRPRRRSGRPGVGAVPPGWTRGPAASATTSSSSSDPFERALRATPAPSRTSTSATTPAATATPARPLGSPAAGRPGDRAHRVVGRRCDRRRPRAIRPSLRRSLRRILHRCRTGRRWTRRRPPARLGAPEVSAADPCMGTPSAARAEAALTLRADPVRRGVAERRTTALGWSRRRSRSSRRCRRSWGRGLSATSPPRR